MTLVLGEDADETVLKRQEWKKLRAASWPRRENEPESFAITPLVLNKHKVKYPHGPGESM